MDEPLINRFSDYLRKRYGRRVHKVALDGGFSCPNRDGTKGNGGCAFCDATGARAPYCVPDAGVADQMRAGMAHMNERFGADRFIAYFQAFTGTYADARVLRERYEGALVDERVIGLSVATRSDCLNPAALDAVAAFVGRLDETRLEFGLQTSNQVVLAAMRCGHSPGDFIRAVRAARARGVKTVAHLIFGLPGDTPAHVWRCADMINDLGVEGVKLHHLYLTEDSRLGRQYRERPFPMMTEEEYIEAVCEFLARLRPEVVVERLMGDAPRDRQVGPRWGLDKRHQWAVFEEALRARDLRQGAKARSNNGQGGGARPADEPSTSLRQA